MTDFQPSMSPIAAEGGVCACRVVIVIWVEADAASRAAVPLRLSLFVLVSACTFLLLVFIVSEPPSHRPPTHSPGYSHSPAPSEEHPTLHQHLQTYHIPLRSPRRSTFNVQPLSSSCRTRDSPSQRAETFREEEAVRGVGGSMFDSMLDTTQDEIADFESEVRNALSGVFNPNIPTTFISA